MSGTPLAVRIPIPTKGDNDDDYACDYDELRNNSSGGSSSSGSGGHNDMNDDENGIADQTGCCTTVGKSCGKFAAFQEKWLGPLSPERAPGSWMLLNVFCLSWSLSLGVYICLLYAWYGNEKAVGRATTTDYLLWSMLTTLVWVVEISLRAAFPGLDTVLVVAPHITSMGTTATAAMVPTNHHNHNHHQCNDDESSQQAAFRRTWTAEESVVTLETIAQNRSAKHRMVIGMELLLAVFFGVETILDCWNHWQYRHGKRAAIGGNYDEDDMYEYFYDDYYAYDGDDPATSSHYYSMLQQQSDLWINVLAYAYMTYETFHQYYRSTTTKRNLQRTLSSTLLHRHHQFQQHQHQHQHQHQQHYRPRHYPREPPQHYRHPQEPQQYYRPQQQQQQQLPHERSNLISESSNATLLTPNKSPRHPGRDDAHSPAPSVSAEVLVAAAAATNNGSVETKHMPQQPQPQLRLQLQLHPPVEAVATRERTTGPSPPDDGDATAIPKNPRESSIEPSTLPPPDNGDCLTTAAEDCCGGSADDDERIV